MYQGQIYNSVQFSRLTGLSISAICRYYNKGLYTGEGMIAYYNRNRR